jgi:hypothetical protein
MPARAVASYETLQSLDTIAKLIEVGLDLLLQDTLKKFLERALWQEDISEADLSVRQGERSMSTTSSSVTWDANSPARTSAAREPWAR